MFNADLSKRWRWLGLNKNPFVNLHADFLTDEEIEATFVYDEREAAIMLRPNSTVLLAPLGGGKTTSRRFYENKFKGQKDTLVVVVDFLLADDPYKLELPQFILNMIARAIWDVISGRVDDFLDLPESQQGWWWAFLQNYLSDEKPFEVIVISTSSHELLHSFNVHGKRYEKAYQSNLSLLKFLKGIRREITVFGFQKIVLFVDNSDRLDGSQSKIQQVISPFFRDRGLYKLQGIFWKWFLPDTMERYVRSLDVFRNKQIEVANIVWTETELENLLTNRLNEASEVNDFSLDNCRNQDLQHNEVGLNKRLVELALQHKDTFGVPRTLLAMGCCLIDGLPELRITDEDRDQALITEQEWKTFEGGLQSCLRPPLSSDQADVIVQLSQDENTKLQLITKIHDHFNLEEIKTLCSELATDFENLSGDTKQGKVRELVELFARHNQLETLKMGCKQRRTNVAW